MRGPPRRRRRRRHRARRTFGGRRDEPGVELGCATSRCAIALLEEAVVVLGLQLRVPVLEEREVVVEIRAQGFQAGLGGLEPGSEIGDVRWVRSGRCRCRRRRPRRRLLLPRRARRHRRPPFPPPRPFQPPRARARTRSRATPIAATTSCPACSATTTPPFGAYPSMPACVATGGVTRGVHWAKRRPAAPPGFTRRPSSPSVPAAVVARCGARGNKQRKVSKRTELRFTKRCDYLLV